MHKRELILAADVIAWMARLLEMIKTHKNTSVEISLFRFSRL
jgi:hypothetical protein